MSSSDDHLKTTMLKGGSHKISEALEPRPRPGRLVKLEMSEDHRGEAAELVEGEYTIGRDKASSIRLDVRGISRKHARIYADAGRWVIEDLGSRNGVRVNETRVEGPRWINPGDLIRMSQVVFRFESGGGEDTESDLSSAVIRGLSDDETAPHPPPGLREQLAPHAGAIVETLVRRAIEGEPTALRIALEHLFPAAPDDRSVDGDSVLGRARQVLDAHRARRLTDSEAESMLRGVLSDLEI